jgi:hypothetical protein
LFVKIHPISDNKIDGTAPKLLAVQINRHIVRKPKLCSGERRNNNAGQNIKKQADFESTRFPSN